VDLVDYRESELERARTADLLELASCAEGTALDVGTRDGHLAVLLADRYRHVTALDLAPFDLVDKRISCVTGDVRRLAFADGSFDLVICAEVLEHIPASDLETACGELVRVTRRHLLIGVPYRQDIRFGRTTCIRCGTHNPPWGHVNQFDESRLHGLFPGLIVERTNFVGVNGQSTNFVAAFLMDCARNPYGTYGQDEPCIQCGGRLMRPPERRSHHKVLTRFAFWARAATKPFKQERPNWIHLLLRKH
jgi:SAM-dependent methyltransferase